MMLDRSVAGQLAADLGLEDLRAIVEIFAGDVEMLTAALDQAAASGNLDGFHRTAHRMAGAAGAVGAAALEAAARAAMTCTGSQALPPQATHIAGLGRASVADLRVFLHELENRPAPESRNG
jgi:HPt (histidine-containing phosphotransfer) domain-containing protein